LQLAQATLQRGGEGEALRALGLIYTHHRKWDEADAAFQQAAAIFTECAMLPRLAITLLDQARSYHTRGKRPEAYTTCQQVISECQRMGMAWHLAQAQTTANQIQST
jgi:tetratricopeptide (TPR) repeat protein